MARSGSPVTWVCYATLVSVQLAAASPPLLGGFFHRTWLSPPACEGQGCELADYSLSCPKDCSCSQRNSNWIPAYLPPARSGGWIPAPLELRSSDGIIRKVEVIRRLGVRAPLRARACLPSAAGLGFRSRSLCDLAACLPMHPMNPLRNPQGPWPVRARRRPAARERPLRLRASVRRARMRVRPVPARLQRPWALRRLG